MDDLRELIDEKLNRLPENDLEQILSFVEFLEGKREEKEFEDESVTPSEQKDPLIGLFEGPPDLSIQSEVLLAQGFREHSGWTWKED